MQQSLNSTELNTIRQHIKKIEEIVIKGQKEITIQSQTLAEYRKAKVLINWYPEELYRFKFDNTEIIIWYRKFKNKNGYYEVTQNTRNEYEKNIVSKFTCENLKQARKKMCELINTICNKELEVLL